MKTKDILIIILLLILGGLAYYVFSVFYLNPNLAPVEVQTVPEVKEVTIPTKGKSTLVLDNCDLQNYGLDCKITKFLEENLAWTNNSEGMDFCSYDMLGEIGDNIYLVALCQEFYVSREEMVCPDENTLNKCFVSKDKSECSACRSQAVDSRIVQGGGVLTPTKLTKQGESYVLWVPRDGDLYDKDIAAEFPSEIMNVMLKSSKDLEVTTIERAEKYFGAKASFNSKKITENSCTSSIDCGDVPGEFAILSNCPHKMRCVDAKCNVGCYDFIDHKEMPVLEK
ncbi:MAG: hypothetical protein WCX30_01195 [Candidatus Paceibacterota bacterium]|jgi:hypothetical protein|nr:hypothetical protein [bacterium]